MNRPIPQLPTGEAYTPSAKQLEFHQNRFETEVKYLHEMMEKLMERLPSAEIKIARRA